ncbi:MAG: hypothetical protein HC902_11845 [Calothrix sp. SM1_5_4]|nr:hypothetical protein [Calothrix sp. SM1_5_4]
MHAHHEFTPNFLPFQITKRRLTSAAGLATLIEAFDQSALKAPFSEALPERTSAPYPHRRCAIKAENF